MKKLSGERRIKESSMSAAKAFFEVLQSQISDELIQDSIEEGESPELNEAYSLLSTRIDEIGETALIKEITSKMDLLVKNTLKIMGIYEEKK